MNPTVDWFFAKDTKNHLLDFHPLAFIGNGINRSSAVTKIKS